MPFCETFCVTQNVSPLICMHFPQVASAHSVSISIFKRYPISFRVNFCGLCKLSKVPGFSSYGILHPHVLYGGTGLSACDVAGFSASRVSEKVVWSWSGGEVAKCSSGLTNVCFSCPNRNLCSGLPS